jgi:hypothetical protein
MNAEYILLRQYIMVHLQNSNVEPNPKLGTSRKHCWLALFETEYLIDPAMGNILQPPTWPHSDTNIPTEWLCPMNIKYYDVNEFLGFPLSKVSFSSTKTSWIPANTGEWGNFFKHSLRWCNVSCRSEKNWCQVNRCLGLLVTSFHPCQSDTTTPWDRVFSVSPCNQGSLFCLVRSRPKGHKSLWTLQIVGHGSLGSQWRMKAPNPDVLKSLLRFPRPHLTEKSSTQDGGTFLHLLPAWLAGLP